MAGLRTPANVAAQVRPATRSSAHRACCSKQASAETSAAHVRQAAAKPRAVGGGCLPGEPSWRDFHTEDYTFPCSALPVRDLIAIDPVTGKEQIIDSEFDTSGWPYAGSFHLAGYPLWRGLLSPSRPQPVLGLRCLQGLLPMGLGGVPRRKLDSLAAPLRLGGGGQAPPSSTHSLGQDRRQVGFVPLHPRDVAGKPPVNLKDGIFQVTGKKDQPIERVGFDERRR